MIAATWLAVFVIGYAAQRGTTCAVIATRHLVLDRRPERFVGFILCAAIATIVVALARLAGDDDAMIFAGRAASPWAVLGGAVIALGAWRNGRCAMGTLAGLGSGDLCRLATLAGYVAGAFVASRWLPAPESAAALSPLVGVSRSVMLAGAAFVGLSTLLMLRAGRVDHAGSALWPLTLSMPVIGALNGYMIIAAAGWSYTALLGDVARGQTIGISGRLALFAVLVGGAVTGGVASRSFALRPGTRRDWARALQGGALMGMGTILVPGGNDTMLLVGLPLLIPNLLIGYAAMYAALAALVYGESAARAQGG